MIKSIKKLLSKQKAEQEFINFNPVILYVGSLILNLNFIDRGRVGSEILGRKEVYSEHPFCRSRLKVGIYEGIVFKYCPKCCVITAILNAKDSGESEDKNSES